MTLEISLTPEKESMLRDEASRRGISVADLAKGLIEASLSAAKHGSVSSDEENRLLDELAQLGRNLPPAPACETYSRETIYAEHD
jgi:hypothetical protein